MLGGLRTPGQYMPRDARLLCRAPRLPATGFTIVEVMIVLAVTGLLFVSAAAVISGRQNQTAFDQAIRQIQSQIQQTINDVAIGYYPNLGNIRCTGAGGVVTLTNASGTEQGANAGCIFLGKALQFQVDGANPEKFNTFSIAGLQKGGASGAESQSLTEAKPRAIAPSSSAGGLPDATITNPLQNGLTTARMWYNNGAGDKTVGVVAFTSSLAQFSGTGTILSGSQQVNVVPVDDSANKSKLGVSAAFAADVINSNLASSPLNPSNGVFICFASGGTNQSGLITIGNSGRQLSVTLVIKAGTSC